MVAAGVALGAVLVVDWGHLCQHDLCISGHPGLVVWLPSECQGGSDSLTLLLVSWCLRTLGTLGTIFYELYFDRLDAS